MFYDETNIEKLRALCLRWNKAAAKAGCAGSEFIDDPEFVFARLEDRVRLREKFAYRKGQLGLPPSA
jgi:hypothetical protein